MKLFSAIHVLLALAGCPLLPGIANRVKAKFGGRRGQPVLQLYYDLWKLLRKGAVYSRTTTWIFRAAPIISLAAAGTAMAVVPLCGVDGLAAFSGDFILFAYLLGLGRFMTVLAALDAGSAFEGMGASREVQFAVLAEPAMLLGISALAGLTRQISLSGIYERLSLSALPPGALPVLLLAGAGMFVVLLAENCRIPFDDPNTHLELTMIHEAMVLDHGGVDFAFIQYAAALKLWIYCALLTGMLAPLRTGWPAADLLVGVVGVAAAAALIGVAESTMARLRLSRVPQLLLGACVLSLLGLVLALR